MKDSSNFWEVIPSSSISVKTPLFLSVSFRLGERRSSNSFQKTLSNEAWVVSGHAALHLTFNIVNIIFNQWEPVKVH